MATLTVPESAFCAEEGEEELFIADGAYAEVSFCFWGQHGYRRGVASWPSCQAHSLCVVLAQEQS
jgi:hypothetical protein